MDIGRLAGRIQGLLSKKNDTTNNMLTSIGINKSYISDMVRKNTMPSVEKLLKIANYLHVSTDFLLDNSDICQSSLDESENELIKRYRSLDSDGKDVVRVTALYELRRMQQGNTNASVATDEEVGQGPPELLVSSQEAAAPGINKPKAPPGQPPKPKKQAQ